ncbi:6,7-dimethyl-8-ribityllumazine synthase [Natronobacterium gregoryi]|uniref:6,7-dimethyl-8-ribityllumazine synthase n=2 Tax=Natronobacterium gregoryi TaxID=44930 RepID=L0AGD7_NATGS|nr:6,7-dimethyl-8-ribityllumazine synthase [Natronobacterium gregoryi]AFZ72110.1 6,7-dimethyl-8-ribityllumazine synthase [Natronobacterium gregoryi SP2]ELY62859.1 6,7-dimethyl-8-ribityllumazine synthase [Natronobacterium gregoryi SP2]PLK20084.1 6,7-dimethyl-8-ribityllumazine synthase [Natronobacterium gregoryi SP2]SFJ58386.1 6,7-dimethyl-8-ribityllumazine synthase [Natronobacterium gregoryi]
MTTLGLVVAEFNRPITEQMEEVALEAATDADAEVYETVHVPGVYDAPLAADRLARLEAVDAVVVVGTVITGDTDHDQVITDAATQRFADISLERDTPVTLGVTGPGMSAAESRERIENAAKAVDGALDLVEQLPDPQ